MDFRVTVRKNLYKRVRKQIESISDPSDISKVFGVGKMIGKGVEGTVYRSELISNTSKKSHVPRTVAIKTTVMKPAEYRLHTQPFSERALRKSPYIEMATNLLVNQLVLQKICPNFTLNYGNNTFDSCKPISRSKYCTVQYNEFVNSGTFDEWSQKRRSVHEWTNAIFQILAGLYSMNLHYSLIHNDFHSGNILVQRVKPGGYWIYKIDGRDYYVPNLGYVFLISDYGFSWISNFMYPDWYVKKSKHGYRLYGSDDTITETSRQSLDISKLLDSISFSEPNKKFDQVFLHTFASISEVLRETNAPQKHIIAFFYGSHPRNRESCKTWKSFCYSTKKYVRGERIETYNLNKPVNISLLPDQLRGIVNKK